MESEIVISTHVPKCAGTTLREILCHIYGRSRVLLDYREDGLLRTAMSELPTLLPGTFNFYLSQVLIRCLGINLCEKLKGFVPEPKFGTLNDFRRYRVIHGHINAKKYFDLLPNAFYIAMLREPLERMFSHYLYWQRTYKIHDRIPDWYDPHIPFEEFALHDKMLNYQARYLVYDELDRYRLIGVQKYFDEFVKLFLREYGIKKRIPKFRINENPTYNPPSLSPGFSEIFYAKHSLDFYIYQQAVENMNVS